MSSLKAKELKGVYVEWYDAYSIDHWLPIDKILATTLEPVLCYTIGFQLFKTKKVLIVCHTFNTENQACGILQIPMKCVLKIDYV